MTGTHRQIVQDRVPQARVYKVWNIPQYGTADEENPQNIARGEAFAAQVINAVMAGPAWDRTLLVWTFDEHGGYYDHVRPPAAVPPDDIPPAVPAGQSAYDGFARYGFRVPCLVASPFAKASSGCAGRTALESSSAASPKTCLRDSGTASRSRSSRSPT